MFSRAAPFATSDGEIMVMIRAQDLKYFFLALGSKSKLTVKGHASVSYSGNTLLFRED